VAGRHSVVSVSAAFRDYIRVFPSRATSSTPTVRLASVYGGFHRGSCRARGVASQACLHAGLRWNKSTNFVANHSFDLEHATAAFFRGAEG
jgi:hypothetical protein